MSMEKSLTQYGIMDDLVILCDSLMVGTPTFLHGAPTDTKSLKADQISTTSYNLLTLGGI